MRVINILFLVIAVVCFVLDCNREVQYNSSKGFSIDGFGIDIPENYKDISGYNDISDIEELKDYRDIIVDESGVDDGGMEDFEDIVEDVYEDIYQNCDIKDTESLYCNTDIRVADGGKIFDTEKKAYLSSKVVRYAVSKDGEYVIIAGGLGPPEYHGFVSFMNKNGEIYKEVILQNEMGIPSITEDGYVYFARLYGNLDKYTLKGEFQKSIKVVDKPTEDVSRCHPNQNPPITIDRDGVIYAIFACTATYGIDDPRNGVYYALAAIKDDEVKWVKDFTSDGYNLGGSEREDRVIIGKDGIIYMNTDIWCDECGADQRYYSYVYSINKANGETAWRVKVSDNNFIGEIGLVDDDGSVYFTTARYNPKTLKNDTGKVVKIRDGKILWESSYIRGYLEPKLIELPNNTFVVLVSPISSEDPFKLFLFDKCGKIIKEMSTKEIMGMAKYMGYIVLSDDTFLVVGSAVNGYRKILRLDYNLKIIGVESIDENNENSFRIDFFKLNGCDDIWFLGGRELKYGVFNYSSSLGVMAADVSCPMYRCNAQHNGLRVYK